MSRLPSFDPDDAQDRAAFALIADFAFRQRISIQPIGTIKTLIDLLVERGVITEVPVDTDGLYDEALLSYTLTPQGQGLLRQALASGRLRINPRLREAVNTFINRR